MDRLLWHKLCFHGQTEGTPFTNSWQAPRLDLVCMVRETLSRSRPGEAAMSATPLCPHGHPRPRADRDADSVTGPVNPCPICSTTRTADAPPNSPAEANLLRDPLRTLPLTEAEAKDAVPPRNIA